MWLPSRVPVALIVASLCLCLGFTGTPSAAPRGPFESAEGVSEEKLDGLLTAIMTWLSVNFDLPAASSHPSIRFLSAEEIAEIHVSSAEPKFWKMKASNPTGDDRLVKIVSVYATQSETIYLLDNWSGTTAAELSVLVHETVHHLQSSGQVDYPCAQAAEKLAYEAQERSLGYFGTSLQEAFEIDSMSLMFSTACEHF